MTKDKDYNVIKGQLQNFKTFEIVNFNVIIRDESALAVFDKPSFARKMVKHEQKRGNKNISFVQRMGGVLEVYPGKDKETITKILIKKLKSSGAKIQK